MKHKRLNRDSWGFQGFPYYQVRIDNEDFWCARIRAKMEEEIAKNPTLQISGAR